MTEQSKLGQSETSPRLRATIVQDDAYRVVFTEGAAAMAVRVEQIVYSCESSDGLVADLHTLVQSAYELAGWGRSDV